MRASLTVLNGPFAGQTLAVAHGKLLIGREVDCQLRPESELISRHHCVLLLDEYTLRVRDLGSRNGTFVNDHRIGSGEVILLHGDTVSFGDMRCRVDLNQETSDDRAVPLPVLEGTAIFEGDTVQTRSPSSDPPPAPSSAQAPNAIG